jgi:hypothetical protein
VRCAPAASSRPLDRYPAGTTSSRFPRRHPAASPGHNHDPTRPPSSLYGDFAGEYIAFSHDGEALCGGLQTCSWRPQNLDLSINNLGNAAARHLADAVQGGSLSQLTYLELYHNSILSEGGVNIARILSLECCSLTELNLGSNRIMDAGALGLAAALRPPTTCRLRRLGLRRNCITESGATGIARALTVPAAAADNVQQTHVGLDLDLSRNPIGDGGALELLAAGATGRLRVLVLEMVRLSASVESEVEEFSQVAQHRLHVEQHQRAKTVLRTTGDQGFMPAEFVPFL